MTQRDEVSTVTVARASEPLPYTELATESTVAAMTDSAATTVESDPAGHQDLLAARFRLLREIGSGGMGTVYAARDTLMQGQPLIAIKLLNAEFRKNLDAVTALERECRRVRVMAHENIVRVFEFYRTSEHVFITMELLEGETFDRIIQRHPHGMPFDEAWPLIRAAAAALAYSHRQSPPFIHYDFKPSNVFLTEHDQVKVLDFGVGRAVHTLGIPENRTRLYETALPGFLTLAYASCEMIAGLDPDPRDDVYSLSCFAYEVLSGSHPFKRVSADAASNIGAVPSRLPDLDQKRNRALAAGLAFDRDKRTVSVDKFIADMDGSQGTVAPTMRTRVVPLAMVAVLIVAIGGALMFPARFGLRPRYQQSAAAEVQADKVRKLYRFLGITEPVDAVKRYSIDEIARVIRLAPRHVTLGSTPAQIHSAFEICTKFAADCSESMYADERTREVTLSPFQLDLAPVSVAAFRQFVQASGYRTDAEQSGTALALVGDRLQRRIPGGSWRNGVSSQAVADDSAVVGVTLEDARKYCAWKQQRLPTEDEWEYVARGPTRAVFPTGDDITAAVARPTERPTVHDGPPGGIGRLYSGLSGNVWQWVNTSISGNYVLKGGSWLETNPANKRAAARRTDRPDMADSDSGFRCARTVSSWPDAAFWERESL